jgi:plastocyanin
MRTAPLLLLAFPFALHAQTISTQGFSFNPATLTVTAGTTITLNIGGQHTMTEVDEATWNANGITWNGGFNFDGGTHELTLDIPGTYYYVCVPHASMGMKGQIIVESNTSVQGPIALAPVMAYPNPASSELFISAPLPATAQLMDATGRLILQRGLQGNDRIPVNDVPQGTYMLRLLDLNGQLLATQQVSIVH